VPPRACEEKRMKLALSLLLLTGMLAHAEQLNAQYLRLEAELAAKKK
jgi:hypothetical protein